MLSFVAFVVVAC